MQGTIAKTFAKPLTIHTYTAPEDGWVVNSHIIEFPTQLFVIDATCVWCLANDVLIAPALALLTALRLRT